MKTKFSIAQSVLLVGGFVCLFGASSARADDVALAENAPDHYVVQKGDTLWAIAGKFLKQPWRWPEIWGMNKEQIKNPHRIYPGNMLVLERDAEGKPRLRLAAGPAGGRPTVKLSPEIRASALDQEAISSIPPRDIEPFLTRPLVVEAGELETAPKIVAGSERRVALTVGNTFYATGIDPAQGDAWAIYRSGRELKSPGKSEVLGYEAIYLGEARLVKAGEASSMQIVTAREEIHVGDRLVPTKKETLVIYAPHAPDNALDGNIIALTGSVAEAGNGTVVALDLGVSAGVEVGHVLAVYRPGPKIDTKKNWFDFKAKPLSVPDERVGLAFVFRVFDKVAYALLLDANRPIFMGDAVRKP
jgi:hypothetical protein